MYSPDRKPEAIIAAALENKNFKGYHVFVEGGGDFKLWRSYMLKSETKVTICNGCKNVIEATVLGNQNGMRCFGIIDRDFRGILGSEALPDNIFITDEHDIELMMCHSGSLAKVLNNYDSSQKIDDYEATHGQVRDFVLDLTDKIGYLKLLDKRVDLNLRLKCEKKDKEIVLPPYENFLNKECGIKSIDEMIRQLVDWSNSHGKKPNRSLADIVNAYNQEADLLQDSWQLSNGHDFAYMLAYIVWKKIGCKKKTRTQIEDELILAYEHEYFKKTAMFQRMRDWFVANNIKLFSFATE